MRRYIIVIVGGRAELRGPYPSPSERDEAAKDLYLRSDLIAKLDIDRNGVPTVEQYDIRLIDPMAVVALPTQLRLFSDATQ